MTGSELYGFIYDWATLILNPDAPTTINIPIIQAFQNSPAPAENYIAIPKAPTMDTQGRNTRLPYDVSTETQSFIIESEGSITLREIGGSGENLRTLLNSVDLQIVKTLFSDNQVSLLRWGNIIQAPRLDEETWKEEYLCELVFLLNDQVDDSRTYIETVEIEENYTTQGDT